jgi:tetratricopeptide (TPR) repeat protein
MKLRRILFTAILVELIVAATIVALRWNSTAPVPPLVDQYTDTQTARELLALPDRFLFDSAAKWRTLGETYAAFGYFAKADGCFRRLAALDHSADGAFHHAYCLMRLGRLDEAATEFQFVIDKGAPRFSSRAWYFLGTIYLRREQADEAQQAFERAGDDFLAAVFQRAKFLVRSGQTTAAVPLIERLAEALPQDVHVWQLRSLVAAEVTDPQEKIRARDGLEQSQAMLAIDDMEETFSGIRRKIGMARDVAAIGVQRQSGNSKLAAERLSSLVDSDTRWGNVYLYLLQDAAAVNLEAGNFAAARDLVIRQIETEQFPTPTAWQIRGAAEFEQEHWAEAVAAWTHAERMKPDAVDHVKLATAIEHMGDPASAKRHLALAGLYAGIEQFRGGDLEQARTTFQQATSIADDIDGLWFYLGECERLSDEPRKALTAYRRCLEVNSAHGRAASRMREIELGL